MKINAVDFVKKVLDEALLAKASDIHIDPFQDIHSVRFRVDGDLLKVHDVPTQIFGEVIARIKILSGLRTDIHFFSQDGRFTYNACDIRVSILPCQFGENAVLRILRSGKNTASFSELGMSSFDVERISFAVRKRHGLILVTGPTGSGKTSTLYTILKKIKSQNSSIVTLEDPIEYGVPGIRQVQINHTHGITFASGLRAILRQDPNIIMVGEIRDAETARIAVHAALTGHLVLSTLHTNSAALAIPRLIDMGIEPYLISATLSLVIAQRLVKKGSYKDSGEALSLGRVGIFETLSITEKIRPLIISRADASLLEEASDMKKMHEDALCKVRKGIITELELAKTLFE
jgi:type II secretory ATPase GspE/PulE/Tfp pilus assembly ATPase PilB-like protein